MKRPCRRSFPARLSNMERILWELRDVALEGQGKNVLGIQGPAGIPLVNKTRRTDSSFQVQGKDAWVSVPGIGKEQGEVQRNFRNSPDQLLQDFLLVLRALTSKSVHTTSVQEKSELREGWHFNLNQVTVVCLQATLEGGGVHF